MYKLGSGRAPPSNGRVSYGNGYDWFFINKIHANSWWSTSFTSFVRICLSHQDYTVVLFLCLFDICFSFVFTLQRTWIPLILSVFDDLSWFPARKRSWRFQRLFVANPQCMVGAFLQEQQIREVFQEKSGRKKKACSRLPENSCRIDACRIFKVHFLPNVYFQHTSVHKSMHNQIWTITC